MTERAQSRARTWTGRLGCLALVVVPTLAIVGGLFWLTGVFDIERGRPVSLTLDYAQVCDGDGVPTAAPFVPGPGPHPVAVFDNDADGSGSAARPPAPTDELDPVRWNPIDPAVVQLVACTERTEELGPTGRSCTFTNAGTIPLLRAKVELTLHDARTAEPVGDPVVVETQGPSCPVAITTVVGRTPEAYSPLSTPQLVQLLGPTVNG